MEARTDAGLRYVYAGNVPAEERESFAVLANRLEDGRCPRCRTALAGV